MKVLVIFCLLYANFPLSQSQNITFTLSHRDFLPWIAQEPKGAIYNDMVKIIEKKLRINVFYKREPWELIRKSVSSRYRELRISRHFWDRAKVSDLSKFCLIRSVYEVKNLNFHFKMTA